MLTLVDEDGVVESDRVTLVETMGASSGDEVGTGCSDHGGFGDEGSGPAETLLVCLADYLALSSHSCT